MAMPPFEKLDSLGIISQRGLSDSKIEYTFYAKFERTLFGVDRQKQVRDFIESAIREKLERERGKEGA